MKNGIKEEHTKECCFLYWDAVGYVTKPVYCWTLSRGGRADGDFGQKKASKQNFIRVSIQKSRTNVIRMTGSVTKGN